MAETPDVFGAYPRLTPPQLQALSEHGTTEPVAAGQVLARAGEPLGPFFAVLDGRLRSTAAARTAAEHRRRCTDRAVSSATSACWRGSPRSPR